MGGFEQQISYYIDLRSLKKWCSENLPDSSNLKKIILLENDQLQARDYCAKVSTWLLLFNEEKKAGLIT